MGETAAKLRLVFEAAARNRGVYLFDEFDALGGERGNPNDVGEARRALNSFLQFLEQDESESILLAATNHVGLLDKALFRRFDDIIEFALPDIDLAIAVMKARLAAIGVTRVDWRSMGRAAKELSYAEIVKACDDAAKEAVLQDRSEVAAKMLLAAPHTSSRRPAGNEFEGVLWQRGRSTDARTSSLRTQRRRRILRRRNRAAEGPPRSASTALGTALTFDDN